MCATKETEKSRNTCLSYHVSYSRGFANMCYRAASWLVSGVLMHRPYKLTLLFVQALIQESKFIWPTWWELFVCLASCVQIDFRSQDYFSPRFLFWYYRTKDNFIRKVHCLKCIFRSETSSSPALSIHFHLSLRDNDRKTMWNLKYYVSKCVQSKLGITQLSLVMCLSFIWGKERCSYFLLTFFFSFITRHVSSHVSLSSLCTFLSAFCSLSLLLPPEHFPPAPLSVPRLYPIQFL